MFRLLLALASALAMSSAGLSQSDSPKVLNPPAPSATALASRCQAKLEQDSPEASEKCFRAALGRYRTSAVLHQGLAKSLEGLGRLDDAEAEYRAADGKNDYSQLHSFAKRMYERGEVDRAIRIYESLFPRSPVDGAIAKEVVDLLLRDKKWRELGALCEDHYGYLVADSLSMACTQTPNIEIETSLGIFRANPNGLVAGKDKLTNQLVKAGRFADAVEVCSTTVLTGCSNEIGYLFAKGRKSEAIQLADEVVAQAKAKGNTAPYLQLGSLVDGFSYFSAVDALSISTTDPDGTAPALLASANAVSIDDKLLLCLEAAKQGDTIQFVLYSFLQKMNLAGQLTETMDALRRVAPNSTINLFSLQLQIGQDNLNKLLYQGYIALTARDTVPISDRTCDFNSRAGIPAGTKVRLSYTGTISCKNDVFGGAKVLVEYQGGVWAANSSGFNFTVASADTPIRPYESKTFEQAIAQVSGGPNAPDTPLDEITLGLMARNDILGKQKIYVNEVAQKAGSHAFELLMATPIARSGNVPSFDLTLLDDNAVNAFSTAGGHIYVDKGMLPVVGDDPGMWSAILAHEVAHVVSHHQYKAYMRVATLKATQEALRQQAALGNKSAQWAYLFSLGGGHLLNMKLSRNDELEADRLGLLMMAQAGIHPDYAELLLRRLHSLTGDKNKVAAFLSSDHPRWETREKKIRKAREEALSIFNHQFASAADSPGGVPPEQ